MANVLQQPMQARGKDPCGSSELYKRAGSDDRPMTSKAVMVLHGVFLKTRSFVKKSLAKSLI